jgi:16S rRNA (cytosine967-C5)-methyltransferase
VQDEGSQLCALACADAPVEGGDERWLDLCAGPGGKAALLGALAATQGGTLDAVERAPHRARLTEKACTGLPVTVHTADGREPGLPGGYDRVLVDVPCSGLGALRRRPEARWRRQPSDIGDLTKLQRELLLSACSLARPGGIVAYVACTPNLPETLAVAADAVRKTGAELLDARPYFRGAPHLGDGPTVQLWPHRHGTDAMFCALLRVT